MKIVKEKLSKDADLRREIEDDVETDKLVEELSKADPEE